MAGLSAQVSGLEISPFSPTGFSALAHSRGIGLEKAVWMAKQPVTYGIDAGRRLDETGNPNANLRLEFLIPPEKWRMAAVLVPIVAREPEVTVLLTLRTAHLSAHAGQVAFPGGKIETSDPTPIHSALREAREEIGLLPELVKPLALLDLHNTGTGFRVIPVMGLVDPAFVPQPEPNEVADVFEVPLSFLMNERNHLRHLREWQDYRILFHAMQFEERFIWGATAAMLRNLYERLYAPRYEGETTYDQA
ncbi:CoA pyrophosphatase [Rhodomicrobium lacus]|uniref:CoA pyrophosphatase n=1 Tax=Rhodomicrobium lacus TaxID=2498452 RepID=UPI001FDF83A5|nr:CoA pyrophosphatase [Rhodomicrobium lacus]